MPSRNVVFAYTSGGAAIVSVISLLLHVSPPSVDLSRKRTSQQYPFLGIVVTSVVKSVPSGMTCGSRYVAPCGVPPTCGSGIGADQSLCVPFGSACAIDTKGWEVEGPVKITHMT